MTKNNEYIAIHELIFRKKNYSIAVDIIKSSTFQEEPKYKELLGAALFYLNDFPQSAKIFEQLGDLYKVGYCHLLFGDNKTAQLVWENTPSSPAQNWGLFFCELFTSFQKTAPSYLQIRCFLERDLSAFLKLKHVPYVQQIIDISEFLFEVNTETNKIIAKTFLYNDYPTYAKEYFNRAFDFTTEDPELYYLLGLYHMKLEEHADAKNALRRAIKLNDNYVPAKLLLDSYGTGS